MEHQDLDRRSLDIHRFLMRRLVAEPYRLSDLKDQWDFWLSLPHFSCSQLYIDAWLKAIEEGVDAVVRLATDESDFGQAIRQCSPVGVLWESPKERWEFLREWKKTHFIE